MPEQWLSDSALNFAILFETPDTADHPPRICIGTYFYKQFQTARVDQQRTKSKWLSACCNRDIVFIAMNVNNVHWISIVHLIVTNVTVVLDSMQNVTKRLNLALIRQDIALKKMLDLLGEPESSRTYKIGCCPQQTNSFDCGMHVISHYKYILENTDEFIKTLKTQFIQMDRLSYLQYYLATNPDANYADAHITGNRNHIKGDEFIMKIEGRDNCVSGNLNVVEFEQKHGGQPIKIEGDGNRIVITSEQQRERQGVTSLCDKRLVLEWVSGQEKQGRKNICQRALEQFPRVFNGKRENDLLKLRRWRKNAKKYLDAAKESELRALQIGSVHN